MADYIKRMLDGVGDIAAHLAGRETSKNKIVQYVQVENTSQLHQDLIQLVKAGKICAAENLLFSELEQEFSMEKYHIAMDFYERLTRLDEDYLIKCNFSLDEIESGIKDTEALRERFEQELVCGMDNPKNDE